MARRPPAAATSTAPATIKKQQSAKAKPLVAEPPSEFESETTSGSEPSDDNASEQDDSHSGSNSSDADSNRDGEQEDPKSTMLAKLNAQLAAQFGLEPEHPRTSNSSKPSKSKRQPDPEHQNEEEEERDEDARSDYGFSSGSEDSDVASDAEGENDEQQDDIDVTLAALQTPPTLQQPAAVPSSTGHKRTATRSAAPPRAKKLKTNADVVVFDADHSTSNRAPTPQERKTFMSSRVSRMLGDATPANPPTKSSQQTEAQAEEAVNKANDRLLSELLSSTLFAPGGEAAGSWGMNGTGMTKPKTKKYGDLAGNNTLKRVLDLSAPDHVRSNKGVGRGFGTEAFRASEMGKTGARERREMDRGLKKRQLAEKERQADLGIHTKTYAPKAKKERTRDKGLAMGIGKFKGGALHLSQKDIDRVQGQGKRR